MAISSHRGVFATSAAGVSCVSRVRTPPRAYSPARVSRVPTMVEPDVVVVPAGDALLGDPPRTEHVNVFAIARRPVRVGEYAVFVDETYHYPPGGGAPDGVGAPVGWERKQLMAETPVVGVSWADAVAHGRWLTLGSGRKIGRSHV